MDDRIRDRRLSVRREEGRRRGRLFLLAVAVLAAAGLFLWLRSSDVFAVKKVTASVTQCTSKEEISSIASETLGDSLLSLSTTAIEEALLTLPYVRSAEVHRCFPDTLEIRLDEYEPAARLQAGGDTTWLIAEDGRVLERIPADVDTGDAAALPLIVSASVLDPVVGENAPETIIRALAVAVCMDSEGPGKGLPALEQILVSAGGAVVMALEGGLQLRLGEPTDLEYKLMVAADIIKRYSRDGKTIEYIDVTVPDRVAVKAG